LFVNVAPAGRFSIVQVIRLAAAPVTTTSNAKAWPSVTVFASIGAMTSSTLGAGAVGSGVVVALKYS
jgi:hypothetical protein